MCKRVQEGVLIRGTGGHQLFLSVGSPLRGHGLGRAFASCESTARGCVDGRVY